MTNQKSESFVFHWVNPHKKLLEAFSELLPIEIEVGLREILLVDLFKLVSSLSDSRTWNGRLVKRIKSTENFTLFEGRHHFSEISGLFRIYFTVDFRRQVIFGLHCHLKNTDLEGTHAIRDAQNSEIKKAERIWEEYLENNPEFI